jgi:hypothetical protein
MTKKLVIRDGIGYVETESATGYSLTSATPADYVAEIVRLRRDLSDCTASHQKQNAEVERLEQENERLGHLVTHLRETCAAWGVVPARLSDEPSAPQICHWSGCNQPIAQGDSYLCSGHRSAIDRGML